MLVHVSTFLMIPQGDIDTAGKWIQWTHVVSFALADSGTYFSSVQAKEREHLCAEWQAERLMI
jgi:hypothetical protein